MARHSLLDIVDFPSLVVYLADELEWPIDEEAFDDLDALAFDYSPEELSLPEEVCAKVRSIKQMRPLDIRQPWAVFYIEFEAKRLPVTVLRRVLNRFVEKKRANVPDRATWKMQDLLFVNAHGTGEDRGITFAHFSKPDSGYTEVLREFMWTRRETHFSHVDKYVHCLQWPRDGISQKDWREQWRSAFVGSKRKAIQNSRELAEEMAHFAREVRLRVTEVLEITHTSSSDPLQKLYAAFRSLLVHDLSPEDFADTYAQTMAYGLFAARAAHPDEPFQLKDAPERVPPTNPFLKGLFAQCFGLASVGGGKIDTEELALGRLVELFVSLQPEDMQRILDEFGSQTGDPVIHFYESFLAAYDRRRKVERGVFYTPQPVVSFIVRSVHQALQRDFGLEDGLADTATWGDMEQRFPDLALPAGATKKTPFINILDPATGTATFLVEVIEVIHATLKNKWNEQRMSEAQQQAMWNRYVRDHLLARLYGFELMMAPYTIAHMKIGLKLRETGFTAWEKLGKKDRVRVYLTNALEEPVDPGEFLAETAPALAHETEEANAAKRDVPVTIVIGNPPYSGHSANKGEWIARLNAKYKEGCPELKKPGQAKWLSDDYVKFMRYAHWRMEGVPLGLWSYITNHSYLDNPTFRGMRARLMESFDAVYAFDLHGNAKRKEIAPDGSPDENVFDIQQGVAICLFRRNAQTDTASCQVCGGDLWGMRENKYARLTRLPDIKESTQPITPKGPQLIFKEVDETNSLEYQAFLSLRNVFSPNGDPAPGIVTTHDEFAISWTPEEMVAKVEALLSTESEEEARTLFRLCTQNQWLYDRAIDELQNQAWRDELSPVLYRPFDSRWTVYNRNVAVHRRERVMRHMLGGRNMAVITSRQTKEDWHLFATNSLICHKALTAYDISTLLPLYRILDTDDLETHGTSGGGALSPNLDASITDALGSATGLRWNGVGRGDLSRTFAAEDVFYFIYGVLHSPAYRQRYREFLSRDFARVPVPGSAALFRELGALGEQLVTLHLLEGFGDDHFGHQAEMLALLDRAATDYPFVGDDRAVKKAGEKGKTLAEVEDGIGRVTINKTSYFDRVPESAWNFHIGGYQVCHKWLADRKKAGRTLSDDDIAHYQKIIVALNETIRIMAEIDEVIDQHGGWPDAFQTGADTDAD